ncbi:MAG: hypothetical protein QGH76_02095 [Phycisphaerales bacterium]|jgi:hypothetical protein|nr:hypothetical protein [Phycisphaerales bacterium]
MRKAKHIDESLVLEEVQRLMWTLEYAVLDSRCLACGRAARGHARGDGAFHLRLLTSKGVSFIAAALVEHGYPEPGFRTLDGKGRFDQLVVETAYATVVVTRCPPGSSGHRPLNLKTGKPIVLSEEVSETLPPYP